MEEFQISMTSSRSANRKIDQMEEQHIVVFNIETHDDDIICDIQKIWCQAELSNHHELYLIIDKHRFNTFDIL